MVFMTAAVMWVTFLTTIPPLVLLITDTAYSLHAGTYLLQLYLYQAVRMSAHYMYVCMFLLIV